MNSLRDKYEVVIGLEVHAQLKTKSKICNFIKQATPYVQSGVKALNTVVDWANSNSNTVDKILGQNSKNVMSKLNSARNAANKVNNILPDLDFK